MINSINLISGKNTLFFKSNGNKIAGNLYLPENFDKTKKYPTVFFMRPATQVKEQASAVYGQKFAAKDYVFFAIEPYNYGESDAEIKNFESTEHILLNISDGISFIRSFDFVDRDKFTGLGLCMGSMYMAYTAVSDKRIKALATVSAYLNNTSFLYNLMPKEQALQVLTMQSEEKQKYYESGTVNRVDILGGMFDNGIPEGVPKFFTDAYDYYYTQRAGAITCPGYNNMVPTFQPQTDIRLNANGFAPYFNTPYLGIRGSLAMTGPMTDEFFNNVTEPKEMLTLENAGHFDLYDIDTYVDQAIVAIDTFFKKHAN